MQRPTGHAIAARLARATSAELDDMAFWPEDRWLAEFVHIADNGQPYIDTGRRATGTRFIR